MNRIRRYPLGNSQAIPLWRNLSIGKPRIDEALLLIPAEVLAQNQKRAGNRPCPRRIMVPKAGLEPAENLEIV
jgi:hypothetical protein